MDQYLNPRNLAAFAGIFAVARTLEKKYVRAFLWLAFAASVHPLMWAFPFSFCVLLLVMENSKAAGTAQRRLGLPACAVGDASGVRSFRGLSRSCETAWHITTFSTGSGTSGWDSRAGGFVLVVCANSADAAVDENCDRVCRRCSSMA